MHQAREVLLGSRDRLVAQLGRAGQPRTRDRLVRRHDQTLQTGLVRSYALAILGGGVLLLAWFLTRASL